MTETLQRTISQGARQRRVAGVPGTLGTFDRHVDRAPAFIRMSNPLLTGLLRVGFPMGPNHLMTVRGRVSGLPRVAPVALIEANGRRYTIGAYGAVNWVRNLAAAGEAVLHIGGKDERVTARRLGRTDAIEFYREGLPAYIRHFPWYGRVFARIFFRLVGPELANDPERAADLHPVFELEGRRPA